MISYDSMTNTVENYDRGLTMKRVAHIIGQMGIGGAETWLMNIYRHIDRDAISFDFIVHMTEPQAFDKEIRELGGHIIPVSSKYESLIRNMKETTAALRGYDIVHIHLASAFGVLDAISAMRAGVKVRILHAHTTKAYGVKRFLMNYAFKLLVPLVATHLFACSEKAGRYMFPNRSVDSKRYRTVNIGVDTERFAYNLEIRENMRRELDLEDRPVIVQVGRFHGVKNHAFTLEAFAKIRNSVADAVLVMVGGGPMEDEIKSKAQEMGLLDSIRFLGIRTDVPEILQAADLFVMPSLFEGFSCAAIEAQTSGLMCLISDTVTDKIRLVPEICEMLPIDQGTEIWGERIKQILTQGYKRMDRSTNIRQAGYDIREIAKEIENIYGKQ